MEPLMSDPELSSATPSSPDKMPVGFGFATATFVIVASMVGTGVLTTSGYTVYNVGSNQLMLGLWVVGGIIAVCGALSLCELSAAMPKTGGDYVYLREAYGPLASFLSGWVSFVIGFSAPSALAAFASAKFLLAPIHLDGPTLTIAQRSLATAAVVTFALIHTTSRRRTASIQAWITALKLSLLGAFIVAGIAAGWPHAANLSDRPPITWKVAESMMFSLTYVSYAYVGWNAASYLAEEIANPQRELPRAILLGTAAVVVLYLGLNAVYALALSPADIRAIVDDPNNSNSDPVEAVAPIAQLSANRLFGSQWSGAFTVAVGLMMLSSLSAYVLTGPRVLYAMAHAGQFPAVARRLSARAGTPVTATVLQVGATLTLLWTGSFQSIMIYTSVGLAIFSMLTITSVYVLRVKRPDLDRPFRTPGYPATPAIYLVLTGILTAAAFSQRHKESTYALLSIVAGVPVYYVWQWLVRGRAQSEPVATP
jgi:APA family basic amino acid/polyamine antiporter